jgi:hypothetical protein
MDDITNDRTGGNILLFIRKPKGDERRTAADKPLLQLQMLQYRYLRTPWRRLPLDAPITATNS